MTPITRILLHTFLLTIFHQHVVSQYKYVPASEPEEDCRIDCSEALDLAFVVDASGSIQKEDEKESWRNSNWDFITKFILDIIDEFTIGAGQTRVSLLTFSTNANIRIHFNSFYNKTGLRKEIIKNKEIWYVGGWTNTYKALKLLREEAFTENSGGRTSIPDVAIVITDGKSSHHENARSFRDPVPQARMAEEDGIKLLVVGVTDSVLESELKAISATPKENGLTYWTTPAFNSLVNLVRSLLKSTCTEVCEPKIRGCAADITFVLDASGSIRDKNPRDRSYDNWELMLDFVESIIRPFTIGDRFTRIALVTFSNNATLRFSLKESHNTAAVLQAIRGPVKSAYNGGETNTHHALQVMHKESFTGKNGDRPGTPNIAIVITDGKSYLTPPNGVYKEPYLAAEKAKADNITILVVGITNEIDEDEMRNISSAPHIKGVTYWTSPDFVEVSGVVGRVINQTCTTVKEYNDKFCIVTTCSKTAMDVAFVIDASGSIQRHDEKGTTQNTNWWLIIDFVRRIIDFFTIGPGQTRVGIVTYSNKGVVRATLNQYYDKAALINITNNYEWFGDGETNTTGGLLLARTRIFNYRNGDRPTVPNVVILITDGHSSHHELPKVYTDPVKEAALLKLIGVKIVVVGVTSDVYEEEIRGISSPPQSPGQSYWTAPSFEDLTSVVQGLMKETCEEECHDPPNCTLDIAFVLDSSGSIGEADPLDRSYSNWDVILTFVQDVINFFKIGSGDTRVAIITFSSGAKIHKRLDDNMDRKTLIQKVRTLPYNGGSTDTGEGLRLLREEVFVEEAGDRMYVPNLAIVITDGQSSWKRDPNQRVSSNPIDEAYYAKLSGAFIVVVGITKNVDENEVRAISSLPQKKGQSYWLTPDFVEMSTVLTVLATEFCLTIPPMPDIPDIDEGDPFCWVAVDDTRVGVVSYSNQGMARIKLDNNLTKEQLITATNNYQWYGGGRTNTNEGLRVAREEIFSERNGDRPDIPNVAILITDGHSSHMEMPRRYFDPVPQASLAKQEGIQIFVVGVTDDVLESELQSISSLPQREGETYWKAPDFNELTPLIQSLMKETCKRDCVRSPRCALDIGFIIDSSDNIQKTANSNGWTDVLDFVQEMMRFLRTGSQETRFAIMTYADQPQIKLTFKANEARTDQEIYALVKNLTHVGGPSNTGRAIEEARKELFSFRSGDRPGEHNIALVISDIRSPYPPSKILDPVAEAGYANRDGTEIFALGVTDQSDQSILHQIASSSNRFSNRTFWPRLEFNEVVSRLRNMIYQICTTPPTRAPPPAPKVCTQRRDIIFALDTSASVTQDGFENMKGFVSEIVRRLDIDAGKMRIGVILFSDGDTPQFHLNLFNHNSDISDALRKMDYISDHKDPAATMRYITETMFMAVNGDRDTVSNTIVWITDGEPDFDSEIATEASRARRAGIHVIAVGVGAAASQYSLSRIASLPTDTNVLQIASFAELRRKNLIVENIICNSDTETFECPSCDNGGSCTTEAGIPYCDCPFGYAGQRCEEVCSVDGADIAFAVDGSSSVGAENFEKQLVFLREVIKGINIKEKGTRCGVMVYSDNADVKWGLKEHMTKSALLNALSFSWPGGNSNTAAAIRSMRSVMFTTQNGDRALHRNLGIIFTDGKSDDPQAAWEEAIKAREEAIDLLLIGVGKDIDQKELESLASAPGRHNVFTVDNFNNLNNLTKDITLASCSNGCVNFQCMSGGTAVPVLSGCMCKCPPGKRGSKCEKSCTGKLDIALVIDTSGSITSSGFPMVLDVIANITSQYEYETNGGEARLGAVTFSDTAHTEFHLGRYRSGQDIVKAIRRVTFMGKRTNLAAAIHLMQTEIFNTVGDREDARNLALVFTDGNSNLNASQTIRQAIEARINGTHILAFGVGDLSMLELKGIASKPSVDNLFNVRSWTEFPSIIDNLVQSTCDDINECTSNPCGNGGTCIDDFKQYWCECPLDYTGETCHRRCTRKMDLTLVLDLGFSTVSTITDVVLAIAERLIHGLPVGLDRARIALVSYSDDSTVQFYLNSYQHKKSVLNAIAFGDSCSRKNTQAAIKQTYSEVFTTSKGDRQGVKNVVVLVTDGNSNMHQTRTVTEAEEAKVRDLEIYVASVGREPGTEEINAIASHPDNLHVVNIPTADDVSRGTEKLLEWLCQ